MSGLQTLGLLLLAPFVIGDIIIKMFGSGGYNMTIIPILLIGEAILVLAEVIKLEETKMEVSYGIDITDDGNKDGKTPTEPTV